MPLDQQLTTKPKFHQAHSHCFNHSASLLYQIHSCFYIKFSNCLSTVDQLLINFVSKFVSSLSTFINFYQLFINFLSTFYQVFINFYQLFTNFSSMFYRLFTDLLSTFINVFINWASNFRSIGSLSTVFLCLHPVHGMTSPALGMTGHLRKGAIQMCLVRQVGGWMLPAPRWQGEAASKCKWP